MQRDAGVAVGARVDQHPPEAVAAALADPRDEIALVVRLPRVDGGAVRGGDVREPRVDVRQGRVAVDRGLAGAEELEVGARDDEDARSPGRARLGHESSASSFGMVMRSR